MPDYEGKGHEGAKKEKGARDVIALNAVAINVEFALPAIAKLAGAAIFGYLPLRARRAFDGTGYT